MPAHNPSNRGAEGTAPGVHSRLTSCMVQGDVLYTGVYGPPDAQSAHSEQRAVGGSVMGISSSSSARAQTASAAASRSRRSLLQAAVAVLATPVLAAACNLSEDLTDVPITGDDPVDVIYATWGTQERVQKEEWTLLSFQRNYTAIKVNVIASPTAAEHIAAIYSLFASGSLPDMLHLPSWSAPTFYAENAVLPLGDYMRRDGFRPDDLTPPFDVCTYRREWVGLPRGNNGLYVVFYNRSRFTTAAVPFPAPTWTWQDFLAAAQQLTTAPTDATPARWGTTLHGIDEAYHAWLWGNGGDELADSGGLPAINQPLAIEALQWLADLHLQHGVAPAPDTFPGNGFDAFAGGDVAMWYAPAEAELALAERDVPFDWGMAPQPRGNLGVQGHYRPDVITILQGSRQPDEAWELAQFLVDPDVQRDEWENQLWYPQAPSLLAEESYLQPPDRPYDRRAAVPGALVRARTPFLISRIDEVRMVARTEFRNLWAGTRSAQEVAEVIAARITDIQ